MISYPNKIRWLNQSGISLINTLLVVQTSGTTSQQRLLPFAEIDLFSQKGLGGIRIAKQYGGAFVSNQTLAKVFRILNKADSSIGQIPQNQFGLLNLIDIIGNEQQKLFIFNQILQGKRLANGGPERYS